MQLLKLREGTVWNYSYYPVVFNTEVQLLKVKHALSKQEIYPRRYFFPSLNKLPYTNDIDMPISESISSRVLCLPIYVGLSLSELALIVRTIKINL